MAKLALDPTSEYARRVLDGEIVAGKFVRLACERHFSDLESGAVRGLYFDAAKAQEALQFFPAMFTITDGPKAGEPFHLLDWHTFVVGSLFGWHKAGRLRFRSLWLETGKGQAKALALDTPIATPSGWTTMGEISAGDTVFDETGQPCSVVKAHEILYDRDCYRVSFDDGSEIIADEGHLWQTTMRKSGATDHGAATRGVLLPERGEWREGVRTTGEIAETLRFKNGKYLSANHSVNLCQPIDCTAVDLEIPPYALGFWLGDGDSDCPRITCHDNDIEEISSRLNAAGVDVAKNKSSGRGKAGRYRIQLKGFVWRDGFEARLKRIDVLKNKHIPAAYLRGSIEQRLELLRGLMDSDGTAANGQCSFCNTNRQLAGDVLELALSLGLKATCVTKQAKIDGRVIGNSYHVNFYPPMGMSVFGLSRKQARAGTKTKRARLSATRKIVGCEKVDSVPVRCISVDSPSKMFLCGREMIPTHNSPIMGGISLYVCGFMGIRRAQCYAFASKLDQAKIPFKDAAALVRAEIPGLGESLEDRGDVFVSGKGENAWRIEFQESGSFFEAKATTDSLSGPRPDCVIGDEIHESSSDRPIQLWEAGIAKKPGSAFMILGTNTPATDQMVGTDKSLYFQRMLEGIFDDDEAFAYIARVDEDDDPFADESCWIKALPALGVTFDYANVRGQVVKARNDASTRLSVSRLYFGIPVGSSGFWVDESSWRACIGKVNDDALIGQKCFLSLDLSEKNDLTALGAVFRDDDDLLTARCWYWTTPGGLERRSVLDRIPYRVYVEKGELTVTEGAVIDYEFVASRVKEIVASHDVDSLTIDPSFWEKFRDACDRIGLAVWVYEGPEEPEGDGLKVVRHSQGTRVAFGERNLCMPHSITRLTDKVLAGEILIEENRLTQYCAANAIIKTDAIGNQMFDKSRQRGRMDGLIALAMAVGASEGVKAGEGGSYLASSGLLVL